MSNRFLRVVGGRYDFRRRIPPALVSRFGGQQELIRSIGSVPHAEALERARRLAVATDRLFRMVRQQVELTQQQIEELAREYYATTLRDFEKAKKRYSEKGAVQAERRVEGAKEQLRMGFLGNAAPDAIELLQSRGLEVDEQSDGFKRLCEYILRAYVEVARVHKARFSGDHGVVEADSLFKGAEADARKPVPKFSAGFDLFVAEKLHMDQWGPDQQRDNRNTKAMFIEWCGDKRVDRYHRTEIAEFATMLQALPRLRGKVPAFSGKTLAELVAMTKADGNIECLAPKSVKKHVSNISTFFKWLENKGYVDKNPARGVYSYKDDRLPSEERPAWSVEQLIRLFSSPLYRGAKSEWMRSTPGDFIKRDARYWLPILGAFHPVRLEEMSQLRIADIKSEEGVWFIDITPGGADPIAGLPEKKLKSPAARRRVPLHSLVLEIGFLNYLESARQRGKGLVFYDLSVGGVADRFGYAFSKWFSRYTRALNVAINKPDEKGVDFHSLRHNAVSAMKWAGVHTDVMDELEGHAGEGERKRYGKRSPLTVLKPAIDAIRYEGITADLFRL
ncbi:DUF6538 domain-containing protein [Ferrovibrio sp.]|uniref:DUF6538 domain-containing protein n=1 Tax=Ferrovibrio sp. TaxID=1917215 RepID=UPI00261A3594|nr:DUF6538 domain-containing protein [Ferrovibrio sp.]